MVRNYFASVLISIISSNASSAQIGKICNWDFGKMATIVLTFNDWLPGHYPVVVPELRNRDLVATFFPIITGIASWNHPWPDVDMTTSYGNEIGNHTNNDNWYARVLEDSLQKQLDVLVSVKDKTKVTTLGKAIKYHREARCAQLTEISAFDGEQWVVNLTDTLSVNSLYNQPLSVKLNGFSPKEL